MINKNHILQWLKTFTTTLEENKDYLTELDAAVGDADHGINMNRGFQKVSQQLTNLTDSDIGTILKTVSMTLISSIGGASGPLYGTLFLQASRVAVGKDELNAEDIAAVLDAAVAGVIQRGRANLGDKTMLDTLSPAADGFKAAINQGAEPLDALKRAILAGEEGMKNTVTMVAKKGRASYLGDRSVGHLDPGATSSYLMLKTLLEVVQKAPK